MARGVIYFITTNKEQDISFGEEKYQEKLESLQLDYVKDQDDEQSSTPRKTLEKLMLTMGANIAYSSDMTDFRLSFCFTDADQAKRAYFGPKLDDLRTQVEALTLDGVIRHAPALDFILDNSYGDIVTLNEEDSEDDLTLDGFVRRLESGVTYYVYNRVLLTH